MEVFFFCFFFLEKKETEGVICFVGDSFSSLQRDHFQDGPCSVNGCLSRDSTFTLRYLLDLRPRRSRVPWAVAREQVHHQDMRLRLLATIAAASAIRRVLVTGANKGIGLQICKTIVREIPDAHILLGSRSATRGEKAVADVLAAEPTADGRIELVEIDVSDDASVASAAKDVAARFPDESTPLYGICNNAGIGFGRSIKETLETNFYGTKRVCDAFLPLVDLDCGRVCNIASASGPNFVRSLDADAKALFTSRQTTWEALDAELQRAAGLTDYEGIAYGLSKAAVNAWTMQLAAANPTLRINSCSPGYRAHLACLHAACQTNRGEHGCEQGA